MEQQQIEEIMARVTANAKMILTGDKAKEIIGIAKSAETPQEGITKAIYYVVSVIIKGLKQKGVDIPPEMLLMEGGVISEVAGLVIAILHSNDVEMKEEDVKASVSQVVVLINESLGGDNNAEQGIQQMLGQKGAPPSPEPQGGVRVEPQQGQPEQGAQQALKQQVMQQTQQGAVNEQL